MTWQERAVELYQQLYPTLGKNDGSPSVWNTIGQTLSDEYGWTCDAQMARERARGYLRNHADKQKPAGSVLEEIIKGKCATDICKMYGITSRVLTAMVDDYREQGYQIDENMRLCKDLRPQENVMVSEWTGDKIIRFGLCGDNQAGSKYTQWTHLHNYYDLLKQECITTVYHTGDISEGEEMRQGHKYECYLQGADEIVKDIVDNYPKGINTYFITGNHDHSIIKRAGYDIGTAIAHSRADMFYLGKATATINLTPNCRLELSHPIDGSAYSISYKTQRAIDSMQGGEKPNILAIGHYHKAEYLFYRNIHAFQTGCFQARTPFMMGKQLSAHVGGWIVEIHVDEQGTITRCKGEFIPYYKMIKDDY